VRNKGSILILALWSIALLTTFSISLGFSARQKATLIQRLETAQTLHEIACSGVEQARSVLVGMSRADHEYDTLNSGWNSQPGVFEEVNVAQKGSFSVFYESQGTHYGLMDEQRKLPLNRADAPSLIRLIELVTTIGHEDAEQIAYSIVDWRDADFGYQHPQRGAEDEDYEDLALPYSAKDAPFEALEELYLIDGINGEIFDKIKDYVSVFGDGGVNVNTASKEVLTALSGDSYLADKIIRYRLGPDAEPGTSDDAIFTDLNKIYDQLNGVILLNIMEKSEIEKMINENMLSIRSTHLSFRSRGILKNGASRTVDAVIDREGKVYFHRISEVQWPTRSQ
jgi:general secretion pathway protein K